MNITEQNKALSQWAGRVLSGMKPKRHRRLSMREAMADARKERLRYRALGHYDNKK